MTEEAGDSATAESQQLPEKVDPETFELRGRPASVVRFRRGLIVGVAGCAAASLVAIAWFALDPPSLATATVDDGGRLETAKPGDALAALPGSYGDVPTLGSPLPGDLGRPILDQAREDAAMRAPPINDQRESEAARLILERRERIAEARRAARSSAVLARVGSGPAGGNADVSTATALSSPEASGQVTSLADNPRPRRAGLAQAVGGASAHQLEDAASPFVVAAGSVISASLITGLNSDLPGLVTAQVTERVYDSPTGQVLLIPQGARLLGTYDSVVAYGQRRALIVWQRLLLPDGSSLAIDNVPATDASGYAGLADGVDFHTWALLKGVALSTLLGVGANLSISGESDLVRAVRESIQQGGSRAGEQVVAKGLDIQPTITIRPGASVRLLVHRDLVLRPWRG
ncbi:TrbI/VirB10 family protein [Novosphingobium sp. Gsoil 351]|uniref:TrbI/VirB10 family protein n=1 Tax=Novosphingobium sp. Gsoil 351 TaxID=2675225 RepID=UPI0012B47C10|nr:TrbI/VirB10 family protein [Novosphingobium sp. Gsoil 351]QGN54109.1 conjugal transfer protein TrbI [Novosphingobium sp. Gsoil 351]